jgi:phosphatidylglycerophosphatase A
LARLERLHVLLATGLGLGRAPIAPGTVGSAAGLLLVALLWELGGAWTVAAGAVVVTVVGMWAAGPAEAHFGRRDPGPVVVDEIAGQMVSLLCLAPTPTALAVAFILFRVFDVWKPFPVRQVEKLPGASGIMVDDLLAGAYANLLHQALRWGFPGWWGGG